MKEFILGGARSGKSAFAQRRATASGPSVEPTRFYRLRLELTEPY